MLQSTRKNPIQVGGNVQASRLIHRMESEYPELAKRARVSGLGILQVIVSESGAVEEVKIIRGHPLLNDAALRAFASGGILPIFSTGNRSP